jgi:hypothetical protein
MLTNDEKAKCVEIMQTALDLIGVTRPDLTTAEKLKFFERYFRHPGAGDFAEELGELSDEILRH